MKWREEQDALKEADPAYEEEEFDYPLQYDMTTDEEPPRPIVYYVEGEWFLIAKHKADDIMAKQDKDEKERLKKEAEDEAERKAKEGKSEEEIAQIDKAK